MPYSQNPELQQRMQLAKEILADLFKDFERMVNDYKIKVDTPEWDIICFHILSQLGYNSIEAEKWEDFWSRNRKPKKHENLNYYIPSSFLNFCCSKEASDNFIHVLEYFKKRKIKLTWAVYLQIFFDYRSKVMPKFNKNEFLVFQTILQKQIMSNIELAKELSMDSSNLSKYKTKLQEKYLIYEGLSLNYYVLNLAMYGIVYNTPLSSKIDFFQELPESPFLHSIYTSYSNSQTAMLHYIAPDNNQVKRDLSYLCESINERHNVISSTIVKFDVGSRLKSFNFSNYDYKKARWDLPYYKIVASLERSFSEKTKDFPVIISEFAQVDRKVLNLNKIGIEILNHMLTRKEMSINAMMKDLNLSEKETRKQIDNLHKNQYFKSRINPNYVFGLSNLVLFLSKDPKDQLQVHNQLSIFPELYSQKYTNEDEEGIHLIIRIPNEIVFDIMSLLNTFYKQEVKEMFVINQMYSRRWLLPTERYETVFQEWKYDSKDILGDGN